MWKVVSTVNSSFSFVNPVLASSLKSCKTCSMKCSYRFEFLSEQFVSSTFSTDWITGLKIDYIEILKWQNSEIFPAHHSFETVNIRNSHLRKSYFETTWGTTVEALVHLAIFLRFLSRLLHPTHHGRCQRHSYWPQAHLYSFEHQRVWRSMWPARWVL